MIKIGVIVQSWHYFADPFKLQPVWELYFATLLEERFARLGKGKVSVLDLRDARLPESGVDIERLDKQIEAHDLFFLWVQKIADYPEAVNIARQLKEAYPACKVAAGGTAIDIFAESAPADFDVVIHGPAEESLLRIVSDIESGKNEQIYRDDWRKRLYSEYPIARRNFLPKRAIVNTELFKQYGGLLGTSAMFQRGCNFKCAYCIYNVPHAIQSRSLSQVQEEIEYLKREYHITGLNLRDEIAIPLNSKIAGPFLETLGNANLKWRGQTKIGASKTKIVARETIRLAAESGCVELAVGVETASQQVMDMIDKRQDLSQVQKFIANCHDFGIKIKMCLILGLPGEPPDIVERTIALIEDAKPDFVNVSGFCPVPGSPIALCPEKFGIRHIDSDWNKHAHLMFRFEDDEHFGLPFEYKTQAPWGRAFSKIEIIRNIKTIQHYLRDRKMAY